MDGVKAAIRREQMLVALDHNQVVGAIRFYKKKTKEEISLYQFALAEPYRGLGLLCKMLHTINGAPIYAKCPVQSGFNEYFSKTGWQLKARGDTYNNWMFIGNGRT